MPRRFGPQELRAAWRGWEVLDSYSFPVDGPGPPANPVWSLEDARAEDLRLMRETYPRDLEERKCGILFDRLNQHADRTLVTREENGEPCGYCHLGTGDTENARIRYAVQVLPHQGYLWDDHVFVAHRRRGLHAFSLARRLELLADDGRTEALTIISRPNLASRTSYAAFGAVRQRVLCHLPALHRTVTMPATRQVPG